ncbi:MAG: ABC transporter ATP-binding protein, partial [Caldilineaceae bacterium]|nr:ABC transporter ATP-binding protein [Caldilineaceae bacterium]
MNMPLQAYWRLLARYLRPQRGKVLLLALLLFSGIAIQLVNPQIIRYFIDTAQTTASLQPLLVAALAYIVAAIGQQALTVGATYVGEDVALRSTNQLREDLVVHCLGLDMHFHHEHTPGELIERIDGDVSMLGNFFSRFTIQIVGSLLLFIGILVVLFLEDWRVGLVIALFSLATFPVLARIKQVATPQWTATRQASAELYSYLEERLTGTEDLRARGATAYVLRGFHALTQQLFQRETRAQWLSLVSFGAASVFVVMGNVIALLVSGYLYTSGHLTMGTVYLIFFYTNLLSQPINRLSEQLEDLNRATASIARVQEVMDIHSPLSAGQGQLPAHAPAVQFRHVTFAYDGNPVLNDLSFALKPGEVLGLLGRTGSGKTTIARLLLRLYDPQAGQILLDDQDVRS